MITTITLLVALAVTGYFTYSYFMVKRDMANLTTKYNSVIAYADAVAVTTTKAAKQTKQPEAKAKTTRGRKPKNK